MKNIRVYLIMSMILLVISCQKSNDKETRSTMQVVREGSEVTNNIQKKEIQKTSKKPLFFVSEGRYAPEMIYVEGGEYMMGDPSVKTNQPHRVEVSSFYMSKYMVTNGEWKEFLDDVKLKFTWDWDDGVGYGPFYNIVPTDDCPAQGLNWYYAIVFCNWASLKDGFEPSYIIEELPEKEFQEISVEWNKAAKGYRLATEAEWEYAARGGKMSEGYVYPGSNNAEEIGRFGKEQKTSYPVGEYKANEIGIYDMGGNADEWCWDWYDEVMFKWLPVENPSVDRREDVHVKFYQGDDLKIIRGGSWNTSANEIGRRSAYPPKNISMTGIRLVRNVE
ncbi:formylglycine-generating enzyme family protein [Sediminispirochaeta bajacaliforniensis]|uniref:formylglycine-generating enzyme family protein n=1 Tax=Sediminispirochaeta bajacaliforniensis TaxID=148 RepID=UPI000377DC14|nr:SUMF1/EgtB/PvdO family nonheme iron enzyme [Sediminispirochaeta bajacaliforniensis]